jgi:hypothetical protein
MDAVQVVATRAGELARLVSVFGAWPATPIRENGFALDPACG